LGDAHGWVEIGHARHKRAPLLGAQAVRFEHAADAPTAHGITGGLHFGPHPARAVALAVVSKIFAYGHLSGRFDHWHLLAALPGVVGGRGYAQHLAEMTYRHLAGPPGDVLVNAREVGWPSLRFRQALTKAF
jgi:hypothetical protein